VSLYPVLEIELDVEVDPVAAAVEIDDGAVGFGSVPVTTPRTCFSLRTPFIRMFHMVKFDGPSRMGHGGFDDVALDMSISSSVC
jgi:hypothetical protein